MTSNENQNREGRMAVQTKDSTIVYEKGNRMYAYLNIGFIPQLF